MQPESKSSTLQISETPAPDRLLEDVVARTPQAPARADGIAVGTFQSVRDDGTVLVSIPLFGLENVPARTISPLDPSQVGQAVALGFESNDPQRPIILGLMIASPIGKLQPVTEAVLDGERVTLTAAHEIELRCGEAALILSADGRIQMRGTYITSYATATQRLLGGSVNVN